MRNRVNQDYAAAVGRRIKELREETGLSQERFAVYADLSRVTIQQAESGKRELSLTVLKRIADYLDISVQDILPTVPKLDVIDSEEALLRTGRTGRTRRRKAAGTAQYSQRASSLRVRSAVA